MMWIQAELYCAFLSKTPALGCYSWDGSTDPAGYPIVGQGLVSNEGNLCWQPMLTGPVSQMLAIIAAAILSQLSCAWSFCVRAGVHSVDRRHSGSLVDSRSYRDILQCFRGARVAARLLRVRRRCGAVPVARLG